jgi:hypothetical protein
VWLSKGVWLSVAITRISIRPDRIKENGASTSKFIGNDALADVDTNGLVERCPTNCCGITEYLRLQRASSRY